MKVIINIALTCALSLVVWMGVYFIWGAGSNNVVGRYFSTEKINYVVQDYESTETGFESLEQEANAQQSDTGASDRSTTTSVPDEQGQQTHSGHDSNTIIVQVNKGDWKKPTVDDSTDSGTATDVAVERHSGNTQTEISSGRQSKVTVQTMRKTNNSVTTQNADREDSDSDIQSSEKPSNSEFVALSSDLKSTTPVIGSPTTLNLFESDNTSSVAGSTPDENSQPTDWQPELPKLPKGLTSALDVRLEYGTTTDCNPTEKDQEVKPIAFREGTSAIKGFSLTLLDSLVSTYHLCENSTFSIEESLDGSDEPSNSVRQRRLDEVVYYLLHMRVTKSDIRIPENI